MDKTPGASIVKKTVNAVKYRTHEEMVRPYVFLEVLTKIKVVRHLIRRPMIFFPGYNAQGLRSYSQKTK